MALPETAARLFPLAKRLRVAVVAGFFLWENLGMYAEIHSNIYPLLLDSILLTLSAVIPLALKWLHTWLTSKVKSEKMKLVLDAADRVITSVVAKGEQTLKRDYLEAKADGKVTKEELQEMAAGLKETAMSETKKTLGDELQELLKDASSSFDLENYINSKIEAEVLAHKKSSAN